MDWQETLYIMPLASLNLRHKNKYETVMGMCAVGDAAHLGLQPQTTSTLSKSL